MPVPISCPACRARLKAPDGAAGRTFRCPKCQAPVAVPTAPGPPADFAFDRGPTAGPADDDANPFEDSTPADEPQTIDSDADDRPRKARRPTAKKKPAAGFNPFDEDTGDEPAAGSAPKRRRYRKDGDYNPFGDVPVEEVPDPVGEGFEFGIESPPVAPAGEFDFGPLDTRGDDEGDPRRRRR
jgi:hypothetical protein